MTTTVSVAAALLLLRLRTRSFPSLLPAVLAAWAGALPLELLATFLTPLPQADRGQERLFPDEWDPLDDRAQGYRCVCNRLQTEG